MSFIRILNQIFQFGCALLFFSSLAQAGVFDIPRFVEPQSFSMGLEPELTLTEGAGAAGNLKLTYGLSSFINIGTTIGNGGGQRRFRAGGYAVFDFFPDVENQPGIGVAAQAYYYRLRTNHHRGEYSLVPYVHKSFLTSEQKQVDPFIAIPFGLVDSFKSSGFFSQLAIGSFFKQNEWLNIILEFDINIENSYTSFSSGVVFYF